MRADLLLLALATPVCAAGASLLSGGSLDGGEAIAAAIVAAIVCGYGFALWRSAQVPIRLRWRAVPTLLRGLLAAVPQSVRVGGALLRAIFARPEGAAGEVARQPFDPGGGDPADAGRRALVVLAQSIAPNGFVLGEEADGLLLHQLRPQPPSEDRAWPA